MAHFLGIDGGGTGCRAALADAQGRVIGRGAGGPANINTNVETAADNILTATREAIGNSGARPENIVATLGLAGGTMPDAIRGLQALLPFARSQIVNDAITAARGALGPDDGILAALGTGSVYAVQRKGRITQLGGRGFLLGDEAGGAVLGRTLLSQALRAADGFSPMTPLLQEILGEYGGIEGIISFGNHASPADFGRLAPRIARSDDPAARQIFDEATAQVAASLETLQDGGRLPVVFIGGLGQSYAARIGERWPIRAPLGNGVDGALSMARELGEQT
ncbi:BadF/BadG/BcrA/BcrD ATPase family protein [Paracoccus sediminicola]|uniref:BadF/BadG/BcrA/BcrD ATPase family protein n=1 Tax=Paracoccus sediminicola TaxID=3017783 RepID=UPI0022F0DC1B|nr:BadF/BadG/BcrA/BcrD ATPase family protein [Paracoccus sediminicola]WBU56636.1 ATPase [Paracoccus sediminicola]